MRTGGLVVVFLYLLSNSTFGQDTKPITSSQDNRRCKKAAVNEIISDKQIIAPESIVVVDSLSSDYQIKVISSSSFKIITSTKIPAVKVCYRVLPAELQHKFKISSIGKYDSAAYFRPPANKDDAILSHREELFSLGDINQGGQISRGITVGNNQDLFVNSSLNLNLEGKISNDLNLRASITDQSLPYQPEGNTQQLQDFDNVYVELYNDKFSLAGGDIVLKDKNSRFLKYLKNVQGGMVGIKSKHSSSSFGLSSAKGQFASVTVPVAEGVLGPYKIQQPKNSGYVIIIANSEKVYLDGKPLIRGYNYDYIIDYNQAEISFTSNVVVTNYSRVRIDYEYAVRDYSRSILSLNHVQKIGRVNLSATYYKEADNPDKPLFTELSVADKELLAKVGNDVNKAVVTSAKIASYAPDKVLYFIKDTLDESNVPLRIFEFTTEHKDTLYTVSFIELGAGLGSYNIKEYLAQGRSFVWVGKGKGSYEPARQLPAPNKKEMLDLAATLKLAKHIELYAESAFSNSDKNLFSVMGNDANQGFALKGGININDQPVLGLGNYKLQFNGDLEYLDKDFVAIDRFRRVEYDRDWSYQPIDTLGANDMVLSTTIGLRKDAANGFLYRYNNRNKTSQVVGEQHYLTLNKTLGKLQINTTGFSMRSHVYRNNATWNKMFAETFIKGILQPGYRYVLEQNLMRTVSDSLFGSANYFVKHEFFIRNNPASKTKFELAYTKRDDKTPLNGELLLSGLSTNARAKLTTTITNSHNINLVLNYRVFEDLLVGKDKIKSITGRVDWNGDIIKKVLRSELNYSVANARVPKREYIFVEVPTGQGTHTWRDDNMDGIKDLNEFYEAIHFDEKNFIKLYVNTSAFIDAFENIFNYRATLKAPRTWRNRPGILNLLSRVSNTTSWVSHYRTTEDNLRARLIPFFSDLDESQILSLREALRTTFFINKTNPTFGMSVGYTSFRKKFLYTNGFESRSDRAYNVIIRWNLNRQYNIKVTSVSATKENRSDYLEGRNYDIRDYNIGPSFSWQPKPTLRVTGAYKMNIKNNFNSIEAPGQSTLNEVLAEFKLGLASRFMFNANVKYSRVVYNGDELTPLGYEMLQGLRPGDNISWSVGWRQKLINGLQINLFYEGRKPEGIGVIHSGRASISALF